MLAGGLDERGKVHEWVRGRLDLAVKIFHSNPGRVGRVVCLGGGTYHKKPVTNAGGFVVHESTACAEYLL